MEDVLKKLDELAFDVKALTTEMRERGPINLGYIEGKLVEMRELVDGLVF